MNKKVLLLSALAVSMVGYAQQDSTAQEREQEQVLQSVELLGRARKDYNSDYSFSASKIALKNMEVSQAITTVTKELLADRGVVRLGDAVKNVSGVAQTSFYNLYSIRGITQSSGYRENRLVNGMATSQYFFSQPLAMNIERVEVIKGPASMTFSSTDPGGTINMVTKKPLKSNRREVSFSVGSWGTVIGALDFTGPLNKDKSLLYRLNVGYENGESYRDLQFKKAYMIAPTIAYTPSEKTNVSFEFVLTNNNNRLDRGQPVATPAAGEKANLLFTPITYAIGAVNDYNKTLDLNFMVNLTHKFTDDLSLNMAYMKHIWNEDLQELRTNNANGLALTASNTIDLRYVQRMQKFYTDNFNAYLNYNWNIGQDVKNKSVLGYDFISSEVSESGGTNTVRGNLADGTPRIAPWQLTKEDQYRVVYPGMYELQKTSSSRHAGVTPMYFATNSAYFMNQMELFDKVIFNIGLRQEWYTDKNFYKRSTEKTVNQNKFLFRTGLMYKATKNINAYASYVEGFQMQTDAYLGYDGFRKNDKGEYIRDVFKPKTSKMYELGVKTEWLDGKLNANLALYNIKQNNVLTYDDGRGFDELMSEGATESSKGIEVDVMGRILPNWMVNAGYAFNEAKLTKNNETYRKDNAPKHSFNLWTRYDVNEGALKNFGIGAGVNYVDEKISWQIKDLVLPAYTIVDAAVYYKMKNMQVAVNVNNLFNKTYWLGAFNYARLFPGSPRNVMLNIRYSF